MTRVLRILSALLILAALMGADSCGKRPVGGGVDSDRPAFERKCRKNCRTATITAESTGPYEVFVSVDDGKGVDTHGPTPYPPEHKFEGTVTYASGTLLKIEITVQAHRSDRVSCAIVDGAKAERNGASGVTACVLTTSQ